MNPIVADNCPDPAVIRARDGLYYLVSTTNHNHLADKFPVRRSRDLLEWELVGHVFPRGGLPAWAVSDFWAPEIHEVGGAYHCYFSARDRTGRLCIGLARAQSIEGPFRDLGAPFIRDERVGLIDPHLFRDRDGQAYLYWKSDGNALRPRETTEILVQRVDRDGIERLGAPRVVLVNDLPWHGDVVEGCWVVRRGEHCYLFYAANAYDTDRYATGIARAQSPLGPFEKLPEPILVSDELWKGPGHGSVVEHGAEDRFVYHAWQKDRIGGEHARVALMARITWVEGWPKIEA